MEMIKSRNRTSQPHNEAVASEIANEIVQRYSELFGAFAAEMQARAGRLHG